MKDVLLYSLCQCQLIFQKQKKMSTRYSEIEVNGWTSFDVPNQFEDLQKQLASGSYYVQNVLDMADINTRLQSNLLPKNFHIFSL